MTDNLDVCYYCGTTENVELHHCIHGNKENRSLATQYHLLIGICGECHRGVNGIHGKYGYEKDLKLQADAQQAWEQRRIKRVNQTRTLLEMNGLRYLRKIISRSLKNMLKNVKMISSHSMKRMN